MADAIPTLPVSVSRGQIKLDMTYRNQLRDRPELNIVYLEIEHLLTQLREIFDQLQQGGFLFNNIVTNNITVNNQTGGVLRRATRTISNTQILDWANTPYEMFTEAGLGTAPGVGFMIVPLRCDFTLQAKDGAYNNIGGDCYLQITLGAHEVPFGPQYVGAFHIGASLGNPQDSSGQFEPAAIQAAASNYENRPLYMWLNNSLGNLLDGHQNNTMLVDVWYVHAPTSVSNLSNSIVYTTSVRKVEPPAADGVAVTPNAVARAFSNWFEIDSATAADWALAAIAFNPGTNAGYFRFQVGTGAAGSEVLVAEIAGVIRTEATCKNHRLAWPIPVGGRIANGSRVAVRMEKEGTNTTDWIVALEYFEEPMTGNPVVSPVIPLVYAGDQTLTPSGTEGAWSNWTLAGTSPLEDDMNVGAILVGNTNQAIAVHYEIEFGSGSTGNELSQTRARGIAKNVSSLGSGGVYSYTLYPHMPVVRKSEGWYHRMRKTGTNTSGWFAGTSCGYFDVSFPLVSTERPSYWYPDTGYTLAAMAVHGTPWTSGAYTVLFTAAKDLAVTHVLVSTDTTASEVEVDLATGTPGNEVVKTTVRCHSLSTFSGDVQPIPLQIARNFSEGDIISARVRRSAAAGVAIGIGYIEQPDFFQRSDIGHICYPAASAAVSVSGNASAWANSAWVEVQTATATSVYLTQINFNTGVNDIQFEIELATGQPGGEVSLGSFRSYAGDSSGGGMGMIPIYPPVLVGSAERLSARWRKTGTSTTAMTFSLVAIPTA